MPLMHSVGQTLTIVYACEIISHKETRYRISPSSRKFHIPLLVNSLSCTLSVLSPQISSACIQFSYKRMYVVWNFLVQYLSLNIPFVKFIHVSVRNSYLLFSITEQQDNLFIFLLKHISAFFQVWGNYIINNFL